MVWAACMMAFTGCGTEVEEAADAQAGVPSLHGIHHAEFFGFSETGDTLWLQEESGTWNGWVQTGAAGSMQMLRPQGGNLTTLSGDRQPLATWSTTHAPHILALGAEDMWRGTGYLDRLDLDGSGAGNVMDLGGDGGLDEEALVASGARVLTSYPFGDPMQGVHERTGVSVMALREYEEPDPLGRAEYIKVFGWLTGRGEIADSLFKDIAARYDSVKTAGAHAAEIKGRPDVFTGSEQAGMWTAPTGEGLVARLIEDAGGHYLLDAATERAMGLRREGSNLEMDLEQCAMLAKGAEAWGKVVYAPEGWYLEDVQETLSWLPLEGKLMFHCNTAEVDYFGAAVLEPDRMLSDLVDILHGTGAEQVEGNYFRRTLPRP